MNGTQTGKSMNNALYVQQYGKGTSQAEAMQKNQAHSLSHCQVT